MVNSNPSRRRFLKLGATSAVVIVVAGVGAYLALQPQPVAPAVTPRPPQTPAAAPSPTAPAASPVAPAAPATPRPEPVPVAPPPKPTPTLVDKANEEGAVMYYGSITAELIEEILKGFMKKYPRIKAEYVRAPSELLKERFMSESRAGKHLADVYYTNPMDLRPVIEEGFIAPYSSPEVRVYPRELVDPNGLWAASRFAPQVVDYRTDLVKGADIPKTFWDLTKPRFKDKLGFRDMAIEPQLAIIFKKRVIGPERWMEWLKALKPQNIKEIPLQSSLINILKQGEIEVAVGIFSGSTVQLMKKGDPIDFVRQPNMVFAIPSGETISKFAPHPNAARLLADYIFSEEGQKIVNDTGAYVVARPGMPAKFGLGIGTGEGVKADWIATVWPFTQKDMEEVVTEWKSVFPRLR